LLSAPEQASTLAGVTGDDLATADVAELIKRALAVGDTEDDRYWDVVRELQRRGDIPAFEAASALCAAPTPASRELGLDVLAQLGYTIGRPYLEETLPIVFTLCSAEEPKRVLTSAICALGHLYDTRAQPYLLENARHPDEDVRFTVAQALPNVAGDPPSPEVVEALTTLTRDTDADVRDWATFGLGSIVAIDTDGVREALLARIDDPEGDTSGEALVGLATRGERRIVDRVLKLLENPDVGNLIVEAAGKLPDQRYLPALYRLRDLGWESEDLRGSLLAPAIDACERVAAAPDGSPMDAS
jgi:HEAT repeat protein